MSKPFIFNLSQEEKEELDYLAVLTGMSVQELISIFLADALMENQTESYLTLDELADKLNVDLGDFVLYPDDIACPPNSGEQSE